MQEKDEFEHARRGGIGRKRFGTQTGEMPREQAGEIGDGGECVRFTDRAKRTICIVCPYCDGENILRNVSPSRKGEGAEIACQHCRCLFTPSESPLSVSRKHLTSSDTAA